MAENIKKQIQVRKDISYTSRDFESLRNDLKRFVGQYYRDAILDVSDASLAGMLIDVAAYVGDVTSYYLDHQFNEISLEKAIETRNWIVIKNYYFQKWKVVENKRSKR